MSLPRPEVAQFFSLLHASVFKPAGFTKVRHTFTKSERDYTVAFQFQGSDWNDSTRPWTFYLKTGIQFPNIPRRSPDRDFPKIHSWIRVGYTLANNAMPSYEVNAGRVGSLVSTMRPIIEDVRSYFARRHEFILKRYLERPVSYLGYLDESLMKKGAASAEITSAS